MRTRNPIERLANAGRPFLADADALVDDGEREHILKRIVGSERSPARRRRRPIVLAVVAAAVIGGALAAALTHGSAAPTPTTGGGRHLALTGAGIEAAGFHFKTPAGFTTSGTACAAALQSTPGGSDPTDFSAAASADGGCVEAYYRISGGLVSCDPTAPPPPPPPGEAVDVGSYQGYYLAESYAHATLSVNLPQAGAEPVYLVLYAHDLTEEQLIAVAQSGLPATPPSTACP
ncbi:MAG TPA: hypothetical protein VGH79_04130 [Gaiellaceae bacterium]|jgi:hypothetical protein